MDKFIGKRLDGRYEFKELIGIGGMANVYKAYDIVENKNVAIKILKDEFLGNEEFMKRFRNESKAVAALSHPNIVRIYDVNFGDRIQYIVMEYIDGITLKEFIEKSTVLKWKDTVHFTVQILRALQHAHDKGIVHRDIKPQNIMLLEDGTIKVMDFGIARFARDEHKATNDKAIGSVHYISPEQASGELTDEKSDIYSVGVMMYEMLTGKLPFESDTPEKVAVMQMQAIAPLPRTVNEEIPEGLEEIIVRAMQKDPNKRYQSAAEMLRDIDEFKRNPSIVFEYKYFSDEGSTKYFNAVKTDEDGDELLDEDEKKQKSKLIPILLGVALTIVLGAAILITLMVTMKPANPSDVVLENFIGKNYNEIKSDPKYANIEFEILTEYNNDQPENMVFDQSPEANMSVKNNSKVTLKVSKGSKEVPVPDVVNIAVSEAEAKLKEKGFTNINKVQKADDKVTENYVISTDPAAGTQISINDKITIYYSYGKSQTVKVPDVVGKSEDTARNTLEGMGFTVSVEKKDSHLDAGKVIGQSIKDGSVVAANSNIVLYVSSGTAPSQKKTVSVPLPGGNGTFTFKVYENGREIKNESINIGATSSYTFEASGQESKSYTIMVSDSNGKHEETFAEISINFSQEDPEPVIKNKNDGVFEKINKANTPSSSAPSAPSSSSTHNGDAGTNPPNGTR